MADKNVIRKWCLEFKKNAISHMTFCGRLTCQPGIPYMYT